MKVLFSCLAIVVEWEREKKNIPSEATLPLFESSFWNLSLSVVVVVLFETRRNVHCVCNAHEQLPMDEKQIAFHRNNNEDTKNTATEQ